MSNTLRILIGGSPCTYWSIAQKNNREVKAEGMGWELFKNYLIAKDKFNPDIFLYENNVSASKEIKKQIKKEMHVGEEGSDARYIEINSALVSAQNRRRFYVHNCGDVEQPKDRGILLKDVLETGEDLTGNDRAYCLTSSYEGCVPWNTIERNQRTMVAEQLPVNTTEDGKAQCLRSTCYKDTVRNLVGNDHDRRTCVAEPVAIGYRNRREDDGKLYRRFESSCETKANALTTVQTDSMVAEPVRVGALPRPNGELSTSQGFRIYSQDGKSINLTAKGGGLYAVPTDEAEFNKATGKRIYEVKDGRITIKGKQYPIKLADGYYYIRKLTVKECCRLQTMPDDYCRAVSNSQAYKALGNGWTAEVVKHILYNALKDVPRDTPIEVLYMYDGIATGRYILDTLGFTNVTYYAYEIDKYPIKIALSNYPDIIECGDAFKLRDENWCLPRI